MSDQPGIVGTLKEKLAIQRSATPYVAGALLTAVAMGWYFFLFVPQKLEYFIGQRFRTLAVASGQIKSKAESLAASLSIAAVSNPANLDTTKQEDWPGKYLRLLVPEIQLDEAGAAPQSNGLRLEAPRPLRATVPWDRVASQGAAASEGEFDDLVVADKKGQVLWQREPTTPRLGNLAELLYAEDDKGSLMSLSWALPTVLPAVDPNKVLPNTATLKRVRVGAVSTWMLVQVVRLQSPLFTDPDQSTLFVAGFVSRARMQEQAMRIPLAWLIVVWLPVAVLFLVLPFIKLGTMNAKERFSFVNLILMATGTIAVAGLAVVISVGPRSVSAADDEVLKRLAREIDERLGAETAAVLDLATIVAPLDHPPAATGPQECAVDLGDSYLQRCDLWMLLNSLQNTTVPELDVAIWLDDRGTQVDKWTTKAQVTGKISHRSFEHFQNLTAGNTWSLKEGSDIKFTIEPLRAPTTSELGVVFAMPLQDLIEKPQSGRSTAIEAPRYLALNIRPHSVVDAVLPPGYGFAIAAHDGKVLFHSRDGLSLEENFFEEVSNEQGVRERMQSGRAETWSGDYHGTPHRIHVKPVEQLQGTSWKIVTFHDLTPRLASMVEHQTGTFRLFGLNLVLLMAAALVGWQYLRSSGRSIRDLLTAPMSPDPVRLLWLFVLMLVALAALLVAELSQAHQFADLLYMTFVLLPFLSIGAALYSRRRDARHFRHGKLVVFLELALLILLVGAIPAAGFAQIVQRVLNVEATERWLESAHQDTVAYAKRAQARVNNPSYREPTSRKLQSLAVFNGTAAGVPHYLEHSTLWSPSGLPHTCTEQAPESGQRFVRSLLKWTIFSSDDRGQTTVKACAGTPILRVTGGGSFAATVSPALQQESRETKQGGSELNWERRTLSMLLLAGAISAAYWARRRLMTPRALGGAAFHDVLNLIGRDGNEGIMLIGPPRTRKDRLVRDTVTGFPEFKNQPDGHPAPLYRIRLLDRTLDASFLQATLAEVSARSKQADLLDATKRLWILVSNLEAQLTTAEHRTAVLELLEKLLERPDGEPARVVVVTTSTDPIAHFHEIFTQEREDIYSDDDGPEVQLSRSSLLLSRFRRCYLPIAANTGVDPWWEYHPTQWQNALSWEAADYSPLKEAAGAVTQTFSPGGVAQSEVPRDELARAFRSQALASYDLLWESCTRCEKIVLVQLAQEGLITTHNCEVVWGLINKGLIVERPRPTIFNNSFRQFLRHIEHDHVVEAWERQDGNGLWLVAGRLVGSSLIAGGMFYLTTQDFSVDSLLPVVSGTGLFSAPAVRALVARVALRGASGING